MSLGGSKPASPQPIAPAPATPTVDTAKAAQQEQDQLDRRRGRASTILTGLSGNGDTTKPKLGASQALGY